MLTAWGRFDRTTHSFYKAGSALKSNAISKRHSFMSLAQEGCEESKNTCTAHSNVQWTAHKFMSSWMFSEGLQSSKVGRINISMFEDARLAETIIALVKSWSRIVSYLFFIWSQPNPHTAGIWTLSNARRRTTWSTLVLCYSPNDVGNYGKIFCNS